MRNKVLFILGLCLAAFAVNAVPSGAATADSTDNQVVTIDGFQLPANRPSDCPVQYDDESCAWSAIWGLPDTLSMDARSAIAKQLEKIWNNTSKSSNTDNEIADKTDNSADQNDKVSDNTVKDEEKAGNPVPNTSTTVDKSTVPTTTIVTDPTTTTPTTTEVTDNTCKPWNLTFNADNNGNITFVNSTECTGPIGAGAYDKHVPILDIVFPQDLDPSGKWTGTIGAFETVKAHITLPCNTQVDGITGHDLPAQLTDRYFGPAGTIISAYHFIRDCPAPKPAICTSASGTIDPLTKVVTGSGTGENVQQWQLTNDGNVMASGTGNSGNYSFAGAYNVSYQLKVMGEDNQWVTSTTCAFSFTPPPPAIPVCGPDSPKWNAQLRSCSLPFTGVNPYVMNALPWVIMMVFFGFWLTNTGRATFVWLFLTEGTKRRRTY